MSGDWSTKYFEKNETGIIFCYPFNDDKYYFSI